MNHVEDLRKSDGNHGTQTMAAKVLIVDDDPMVLDTLVNIMESGDFSVATAGDGRQALKKCQSGSPELIILDMIMPEMEGLETIRQVRAQFPNTKIIAISGGGSLRAKDYLDVARKLGAHAGIPKPCTAGELLQTARSVLGLA
jgi:CheY-like chemotaxis protein